MAAAGVLVGVAAPAAQAAPPEATYTYPDPSLVAAAQEYPDQAAAKLAAPGTCIPEDAYHYNRVAPRVFQASLPDGATLLAVYGDGGLTIHIDLTAGMSVTATATGSVSGEVNAIVANANYELGLSIALGISMGITDGASLYIPTQYSQGWIAAGASGDVMDWSHGHYAGCTWVIDRSGYLYGPIHMPYFWHGFIA